MIFLADTTCILALYMITQTMAHLLQRWALLHSAGIVIYRRFCRVSSCFHAYSVACENLNTCTHFIPPRTSRPPHTVLPRLRRPFGPRTRGISGKRVRRTPRRGVLTEKDAPLFFFSLFVSSSFLLPPYVCSLSSACARTHSL